MDQRMLDIQQTLDLIMEDPTEWEVDVLYI